MLVQASKTLLSLLLLDENIISWCCIVSLQTKWYASKLPRWVFDVEGMIWCENNMTKACHTWRERDTLSWELSQFRYDLDPGDGHLSRRRIEPQIASDSFVNQCIRCIDVIIVLFIWDLTKDAEMHPKTCHLSSRWTKKTSVNRTNNVMRSEGGSGADGAELQ